MKCYKRKFVLTVGERLTEYVTDWMYYNPEGFDWVRLEDGSRMNMRHVIFYKELCREEVG